MGDGETVQQLRELVALAEDLGLVLSAYMACWSLNQTSDTR